MNPLTKWVLDRLETRRCLRMMAASDNPQAFRGEPRPKPKAVESNRAKVDRMLSNMEPVPLPDNPSEDDIAKHLGISVQQLREVMQGQTVDQLAERYGVTAGELVTMLGTMLKQQPIPPKPGDTLPVKAALTKLRSYGYRPLAAIVQARAKRADLLAGRCKVGALHRDAVKAIAATVRKIRGW